MILRGSRHVRATFHWLCASELFSCSVANRPADFFLSQLICYSLIFLAIYSHPLSGMTLFGRGRCLFEVLVCSCLLVQITRRASSLRLGTLVQGLARRAPGSLEYFCDYARIWRWRVSFNWHAVTGTRGCVKESMLGRRSCWLRLAYVISRLRNACCDVPYVHHPHSYYASSFFHTRCGTKWVWD